MRVPGPMKSLIGLLFPVLIAAQISAIPASSSEPATTRAEGPSETLPEQQTATWLGVSIQNPTPALAATLGLDEAGGALVTHVVPGSPAKQAGLRLFDVVLEIDGLPVGGRDELCRVVRGHTPGRRIELKVWRNGRPHRVVATLATHPLANEVRGYADVDSPQRRGAGGPRLGVTVMRIEKGLARYFKTQPGEGVLITEVAGHSPAEKAGLEPGDVILLAGEEQIGSPEDLREALRAESGGTIKLKTLREGQHRVLDVDLTMPGWRRPHAYWLPGPRREKSNTPRPPRDDSAD